VIFGSELTVRAHLEKRKKKQG
jgi:hypothetical protein